MEAAEDVRDTVRPPSTRRERAPSFSRLRTFDGEGGTMMDHPMPPTRPKVNRGVNHLAPVVIVTLGVRAGPLRGQTQVSGRDRGFVPFSEPPINYLAARVNDPAARLQERIDRGAAKLEYEPEHGYQPRGTPRGFLAGTTQCSAGSA